MNFYQGQVLDITNRYLPKPYLVRRAIDAKQSIDQMIFEGIDLDKISRLSGLSKFHMIRLFKLCYGKTPYKYITERRIETAKQLLMEQATITDVCYRLGFESKPSFTTYFKRHTGILPSVLRRKAISNKVV